MTAAGLLAVAGVGAFIVYAGPVAGEEQQGTTSGRDRSGTVTTEDAPVPAELTGPGIRLVAKARPDGSFDVTETMVLRDPQSWLVLSPPVATDADAEISPRAEQVRVTTEGRVLSASTDTIDETRDVYLSAAVTRVELRYRLTGVTVRSKPSTSHRALSLIAPLSAATDETLKTTMSVSNALVRVVLCPELPDNRRYCSPDSEPSGNVTGVVTNVAAGDALAQYQLDLPTR